MSNQRFSITPAIAVTDSELSDSEFRTLSAYGVFGDKNGWCWPSDTTIAEMRNISRRTVIRHRKKLIEAGYINVHKNFDDNGSQTSNIIQIKFDYPYDTQVSPSDIKDVTPPVTPECHTPSDIKDVTQTPHLNAPLNDPNINKDFASLSAGFSTASGIPAPAFGGRGWTDWEDGINELAKIKATNDEMVHAVKILDEGGYSYTRPGSLTKTIINSRKNKERKNESQRVGGQLVT